MDDISEDFLDHISGILGHSFFDYQMDAFDEAWNLMGESQARLCLYYKTGAGKSITALVCMKLWDFEHVLVITPPSTFGQWEAAGEKLGIKVECMSHAKFRMKDTKVSKTVPIIADEFHLFGGHTGKGWKKFDMLARHLKAPIILASATPNYNDAERVYCIQHVLAPHSCKGGYIEFLYANCVTEQDPFSTTPKVVEFRNYADAAEYLSALPEVLYLADDLVYSIVDSRMDKKIPQIMRAYGANPRRMRMIASTIERMHTEIDLALINGKRELNDDVRCWVLDRLDFVTGPTLIYADHSTVAEAAYSTLRGCARDVRLITGDTSRKQKLATIEDFKAGGFGILIGTASLATGTDGLDRVCDQMLILDDTNDDSLRRQLVGRIMPRGGVGDVSSKHVERLLLV